MGIGDFTGASGTCAGRLMVFAIAAFITSDQAGLMPQARHGGSGIASLAV
jgi:hypothetical protein